MSAMSFFGSLETVTSQVAWTGPAAAALAGLAAGLTPAYLPLASAMVGLVLGGQTGRTRRTVSLAVALVAGMATVTATVGALFGAGGTLMTKFLSQRLALWYVLGGALLILSGLGTLRLLPLRLPAYRWRASPVSSPAGAFFLGLPFGLTTCPSCVPLLLPLAAGAAASGNPWFGAALFGSFTVGLGLPMVLLAGSTGALGRVSALSRTAPWLERGGGALLIGAGLWFLYQAFTLTRV